ncbi:MAG: NPCBM/NEW2 domain-containing protein [Bacteroidia bacterium]
MYIAFGDGGGGFDEFNSSQQIDQRFWGGIIRIDVDNDSSRSHPIRRKPIEFPGRTPDLPASFYQGYMIPNDNPWISEDSTVLEEFWGLGLRNPHRATFDPVDKEIWIGDVGQGKYEEVTVMPKGGNAQWSFREGKVSGERPRPDSVIGKEVPPVYDYGRWDGNAIIGGFVYRGARWSQYLDGLYLFGDNGSQDMWSFNPNTREVRLMVKWPKPPSASGSKSGLSSFATNEAGDVFALSLFGENLDGGKIYRLELDEEPPAQIPRRLSETGAFSDLKNMIPAAGVMPYTVNSPLWSDRAVKRRWVAIPNDGRHNSPEEQVSFFPNDEWQFPTGTVFIKHFDLPVDKRDPSKTRKLETRFFILDDEGQGYGLTYKWNEEETDAILLDTDFQELVDVLDESGNQTFQTWEYPGRQQCMSCHNANANFVLGLKTWQLNGDLLYPKTGRTANQLETWNKLGIFSNAFDEDNLKDFPKAAFIRDTESSLQQRVLSYIDANCAHCHRPGGVEGAFDARFNTRLLNKNLINAPGISHNNPAGGKIVVPGQPNKSQLWLRDRSVDFNKMPPLAKNLVHEEYMKVLTAWINSLGETCEGDYLSDLEWEEAKNGEGPVERDLSVGYEQPNDGQIISIAGKKFTKGLGTRAYAEVRYALNGAYQQFSSYIGIDDRACDQGKVHFEVWIDGELRYESPDMAKNDEARFINIDISGGQSMILKVITASGVLSCDQADWANARLLRSPDSDGDGVCDDNDLCPGFDDKQDLNNDGIPDGCEQLFTPLKLNIAVMPSPFPDYTDIILSRPDEYVKEAKLSVFDMAGRLVYQDMRVGYGSRYSIGHAWEPGLYIIKVQAGPYENQMKVVKVEN